MLKYCLKRKIDTRNINLKVLKIKNGRTMLSSKCAICGSGKSRFVKEQEVKGFLNNIGLKKPFSKIPILGDVFCFISDIK